MLIKSNFKDYYDSSASTGVDTSIIYNRETTTVQLEDAFFLDRLPAYFPDDLGGIKEDDYSDKMVALMNQKSHCQFTIIGFCGTLYVGVFVNVHAPEELYQFAYFGDDILTLNWSKEKTWRGPSPFSVVENCVKMWHGKQDDTFFKQLKAPIFSVAIRHPLTRYETNNLGLYMPKFTVNTPLSIFQFYKIFDPYSAFQAVQSYVSGVLGAGEKPIIEVSNKTKIVKAGFDLKTSFRKDKEK
jgi:hypothetical protein